MLNMSLANTVLITGANRGIGLEFVNQFLKLEKPPQKIIATCRDRTKATELCELEKSHQELVVLELELTNYSTHSGFANKVEECVGEKGLNLLINNAGMTEKAKEGQMFGVPLEELDPQEMSEVLQVNTVSPLMIIKVLLPLLKIGASKSEGCALNSCVVNMSSILGSIGEFTGNPDIYCYRSSKAALNMLTKSLSVAYADSSVKFLALHPGWVRTRMGTEVAHMTTEESVMAMIKLLFNFKEEYNGQFVAFNGVILPW